MGNLMFHVGIERCRNISKSCPIFSKVAQYLQNLPNIFKSCPISSEVAQYLQHYLKVDFRDVRTHRRTRLTHFSVRILTIEIFCTFESTTTPTTPTTPTIRLSDILLCRKIRFRCCCNIYNCNSQISFLSWTMSLCFECVKHN